MTRFLIILVTLLSVSSIFAQSRAINSFINKYEGIADATNVNITGDLLNWVTKAAEEEGGKTFVSKLESLRVLSVPNRAAVATKDLTALRQSMQANNYEELIRVRDGKELVYIYLHENKEQVIEELVVLVESQEKVTLVSLTGLLHYEDLQQLNLDGEAGEALGKLPVKEEPRP
jgi:hypothetical protein